MIEGNGNKEGFEKYLQTAMKTEEDQIINNTIGKFTIQERVIVDYTVQPIPENIIDYSSDDSQISNQGTYSSNESN